MDASKLRPGDRHYTAFVGPPGQYDFMGATQFRLLCALGLRAHHYLLDFGCGSLRAGRLFISYLDRDRYYGIEPNEWLIGDAIGNQIGEDVLNIKRPRFDRNAQFQTDVFGVRFDYIVAQSIFSHAGSDSITLALRNFRESLAADGIMAVTFMEGAQDYLGSGWVYPNCVRYRRSTIGQFAGQAGLCMARLPWYHPRQTWYVMAQRRNRIPNRGMMRHLQGAVLFDPEFVESWRPHRRIYGLLGPWLRRFLPNQVKVRLGWMIQKKLLGE